METPAHIRRQHIVGGNLALDLLNTQNGSAGEPPEDDALHGYDDLLAWGHYIGLLTDLETEGLRRRARRYPAEAQAVFERTLATRAYLYDLFSAIAGGLAPTARTITRLQQDEADALAHAALVPSDGTYGWRWAADDLSRPLWPIIHAASELLTSGPLDRVKGCAACRFHFVDESKNRSRRWCSMDDCGAADKMRKYVARRASARAADRQTR